MRIDLRKEPYALSEEDIRWVNDTIASTALEEKIGQLFCPIGASSEKEGGGYIGSARRSA